MNNLLQRQLNKHLSKELRDNKSLQTFFEAVDRSYGNYEGQLSMSQRAMMISSEELHEAYAKLKEEASNLKKIINSLNYVVKVLKLESVENLEDVHESVNLVQFIEKQSNDIIAANNARDILLKNLEEKNQELNNYAHIVSHDLKSPLRSIYTLTNWIIEEKDNKLTEEGELHFNLILENLEKMESLINGILNYSSIVKSQMPEYEIDTLDLVNEIVKMMLIPDNINISIDQKLPLVKGDKFRIQQVFQNLIQNAINSFESESGNIDIGVDLTKVCWEFHIKDTGKGIETKYFDKIFNIFESLEGNTINSGIGLSIVKKVINFYQGEIWLNSEVLKGSTFFFTLPKNKL